MRPSALMRAAYSRESLVATPQRRDSVANMLRSSGDDDMAVVSSKNSDSLRTLDLLINNSPAVTTENRQHGQLRSASSQLMLLREKSKSMMQVGE